ncbi:hypothetical protein [Solirubrum puertoriconensis]|uniref:Uncharacterized protein n=1 Tax=Solirubrum puertoriconensis TaxID=1751427 RepID=A0A9X0L4Z1_SOLP1|nr:hypothetical protein [Solirubrum puertoriconensis]KUG08179.1 hypothetical protein ASU33_08280 [Solirubrum puertoriconensis]
MNYNFFASKTDKLALLDYLFTETDLRLYELSSAFGTEVKAYISTTAVVADYDLKYGSQYAACFKLWSPRFGATPNFRRIELNPQSCQGHTFRYATEGWGLIQLYFGGQQNGVLAQSQLGHFNEKGALAREDTYRSRLGLVAAWNWPEINATSHKLKHLLHSKRAVEKIGSIGILPGAAKLAQQGIVLS